MRVLPSRPGQLVVNQTTLDNTTMVTTPLTRPAPVPVPATTGGRRLRPVVAWAFVGVAVWVLQIAVLAGWILSGDATPTPTGVDAVPGYMKTAAVVCQYGGLVCCAVFLWFFLVRPWRRERRITLDGLFCLVFATIFWQDTLINGFQYQVM